MAETRNVEICIVEVWILLDGFAVVLSLLIQGFDERVGLCMIPSNIDALTESAFNVFFDKIDEVFDLERSTIVIDTVKECDWKFVFPSVFLFNLVENILADNELYKDRAKEFHI